MAPQPQAPVGYAQTANPIGHVQAQQMAAPQEQQAPAAAPKTTTVRMKSPDEESNFKG